MLIINPIIYHLFITPDRIGVQIELNPTEYRIGSNLQLRCLVRSLITGEIINPSLLSSVTWFINSDIPLSLDNGDRGSPLRVIGVDGSNNNDHPYHGHYQLLDNKNSTLIVYRLSKVDSGEYRCRASAGPNVDAIATVHIQVESKLVCNNVTDNFN